MPFDKILDFAQREDFVYLDPPYIPLSKTSSFTSYSKEDFSLESQKRLAEVFRILDSRGSYIMLSNSDHPAVRELYRSYAKNTVMVRAKRMINSVGTKRGAINEIVVRNYGTITLESFLAQR